MRDGSAVEKGYMTYTKATERSSGGAVAEGTGYVAREAATSGAREMKGKGAVVRNVVAVVEVCAAVVWSVRCCIHKHAVTL